MKNWIIVLSIFLIFACQPDDKPKPANQENKTSSVNSSQHSVNDLPSGITLVEKVDKKGDELVIPYEKYQLENGLKIIIHQDYSDPLVHVDVTYHVGSAREEVGKSGFAHFFEHMMFQGSEHVADEEHFKIVSESGGTLNGTTNSDRTNYYQTVPVNQLEKMLWLESDRMGFLLKAVTQKKFETQRETVKNERGQRVDNRPYGRLNERVSQALYPAGHPYSWPVIGFMDDLNRVNVNDLKKFFLRWYGPNNATITIGGSVDTSETLALVKKYFSTIPRGPEVDFPKKDRVTLNSDRYISMEDNVHLPLIYFSYPTVYGRHKDEAALDLLSEILGGGKSSIFYKNLVKNSIAVNAGVSHPCQEIACTFNLYALPSPRSGKSLADIEVIIRDSIAEFEKRGVTDDDLIKAKAKVESQTIFGLQSVSGKVSSLAAFETFTGNPNYLKVDLARYNSVTKKDVMDAYNTYLKGKFAVILSIVPNGSLDQIARKDNFAVEPVQIVSDTSTKESDLEMRVAKDTFDRSVQPKAGANPLVSVPKYWNSVTKNGINVLGSLSDETPTTSILIKVPGGHYSTSINQAGLASLTAQMLNESTQDMSSEQMSVELEKLGSSISIYATTDSTNIYISSLTKNLEATLELVLEKLIRPAFKDEDFQRLKAQRIQGILNSKKQPESLATQAWLQLLYGKTIAGLESQGTVETVTSLNVEHAKSFYQKTILPKGAELIVVSDLPQKKVEESLAIFNSWMGEAKVNSKQFSTVKYDPKTVYMVNKDSAAQSVIRIGKRGLVKDFTGEFFKSGLMNFNLGGAFNSRINLNLREDKGYTYGASSYFWGSKNDGGYTASASVRADVTDKSFIEFIKEISHYHENGMTENELEFMKNAIGQRDALKYETPDKKLSFLANILEYQLDENFMVQQSNIINTITLKELNALANRHLDINTMAKLVVGDVKALQPQFEKLGYKVELITLP